MPLKSFIVNYIFKEITCLSVLEWNFQNDMTNYIKKLRLFYSRSFFCCINDILSFTIAFERVETPL